MTSLFTQSWSDWPAVPPLVSHQVWVWRLCLKDWPWGAEDESLLAIAERERAQRYRRGEDRHRFVLTRCWLRRLLGVYLGQDPRALRFEVTSRGKPFLAGFPLLFNLSHSGDWALLAFGRDRPLGIDVEAHRSVSVMSLARRFFQPSELARLEALPPTEQERLFFEYWTAKEAYLKATGEGLGALSRVAVDEMLLEGDRRPLWRCWRESDCTPTFEAQRLPLEPGYSAAIVVGPAGGELFSEPLLGQYVTKFNNKSARIRIDLGTISAKMRPSLLAN
ncbi:MAG: 4'-phosphopantetheinyl transferase superfamily protein [Sodalinema sp.]|uniref:4'-phosphopantetheinyl transferase family protein n=1 Tax=Sodalinema sp. TaxID=3080550 RepID=UPI001215EC1B|nr:MAG: 4'-phosphopantetheinyl transferase superfamily protein [Phormidium sp. SL48-SHIP]